MVVHKIFIHFLLDIAYAPVWWYSFGIKKVLFTCIHIFESGNESFAPGLWLKNLFVPMFGQTDWQGRIASFFVRAANVFFRSIALFVWAIFILTFFVIWVVSPIIIVTMLMSTL